MPPHQHGAHTHARPPAQQPLRNAWALGLWHEPPRIRRRRRRGLAVLALVTALLAITGWTLSALPGEPDAIVITRVAR